MKKDIKTNYTEWKIKIIVRDDVNYIDKILAINPKIALEIYLSRFGSSIKKFIKAHHFAGFSQSNDSYGILYYSTAQAPFKYIRYIRYMIAERSLP